MGAVGRGLGATGRITPHAQVRMRGVVGAVTIQVHARSSLEFSASCYTVNPNASADPTRSCLHYAVASNGRGRGDSINILLKEGAIAASIEGNAIRSTPAEANRTSKILVAQNITLIQTYHRAWNP